MSSKYTNEDLRDAIYKNHVDNNAEIYEKTACSLEERVASYEENLTTCDNSKEGIAYFWDKEVPAGVERYHRGEEILKDCEVVTSRTSPYLRDPEEELPKNRAYASPVDLWSAGYVATQQAHYYVCLMFKKGSAEERAWFAEQAKEEQEA